MSNIKKITSGAKLISNFQSELLAEEIKNKDISEIFTENPSHKDITNQDMKAMWNSMKFKSGLSDEELISGEEW